MKKFFIIPALLILTDNTEALPGYISEITYKQPIQQKAIGQGSTLYYQVKAGTTTGLYAVYLDSVSDSHISMSLLSPRGGSCRYTMYKHALDSAVNGFWEPPQDGLQIDLKDDQLFILFSKKMLTTLQLSNEIKYDGINYHVINNAEQYFVQENSLYTALLEGSNKTSKIWLLNNDAIPIIIKIQGNPLEVDAELTAIEN